MAFPNGSTFFIETLGCQMNVYDSELLRRRLLQRGFRASGTPEEADVILVNSCGVRRKAEARAWTRVARYKALKKDSGLPLVVLCGCVASREGQGLADGHRVDADLVAGCGSYDRLLPVLETRLASRRNGSGPVRVEDSPGACYAMPGVAEPSPLKVYVSISQGCDSWCSYCVVPSARGPHRSRPLEDIVSEARRWVEGGAREITLLGQNVNVYDDGGRGFVDVLGAMERIPDLWRVRFTSPHPRDMTREVLEFIGRAEKACEHLHLPLQSGCDETLKAMNRGYTTAEYRTLIKTAREQIPGLAVSTDLMVGFPGETDEQFDVSLAFVEEMGFDAAFTFQYSPRPGTLASGLPGQVPEAVKGERLRRLLEVQNRVTDLLGRRLIGRKMEVLVEGTDPRNPSRLSGRTRTNKLVSFEGESILVGTRVIVEIESAGRWTAFGRRATGSTRGGGQAS